MRNTDISEVLLTSHPKMITMVIDKNEKILNYYGESSTLSNLTTNITIDQHLKDIFLQKAYQRLKKIIQTPQNDATLKWKTRHYEVHVNKIEEQETFIILYFFDITPYSEVESKLSQSLNDLRSKKEELQAVFDLAANGISILDHNGMFLYANTFFQQMMEYSMEELYRESCISLSSSEYAQASETAVAHAIKHGSIQNFRKVCVTKSGKYLNASMSLSYLQNRNEILMITSDITQDIKYQEELKKQVEEELSKRTEQYEIMCHQSRLAAMGEMIDSIAHQWRQPLNALGMIIQGMKHLSNQKDLDKVQLAEMQTEIMEKISYMSQTIDDFSTFFRISKQKERFNIIESIEDAIRLIDVQLKSYNIQTTINKADDSLETMGLPNEFRQVILNIIHNAMTAIIKTDQKSGQIIITTMKKNNKIIISISDNGGGIKSSNLAKIFDPYFTTRENGSGIGLYMSKVIIEHHMQGRLSVQNQETGAEFTITLYTKAEGN